MPSHGALTARVAAASSFGPAGPRAAGATATATTAAAAAAAIGAAAAGGVEAAASGTSKGAWPANGGPKVVADGAGALAFLKEL